jgi:hypothetical protein
VSYRYRGSTLTQYGLIAEQVARRFPALVQRGPDGRPSGVYYQQMPALLPATAERQQQRIHTLAARIHREQAQIDWLMRHVRRR